MKLIIMKHILMLIATGFIFAGCSKFIEVPPGKHLIEADGIFNDETTAESAVTAMYYELAMSGMMSNRLRLSSATALAADEMYQNVPNADGTEFFTNMVTTRNGALPGFWGPMYKIIYQANSIIKGLSNAPNISPEAIARLRGEAYLMRAMCHFYLTNFFGDVPLITTTDYRENILVSRSPQEKVFAQIKSDLLQAESDLQDGFLSGQDRFRPNKAVATAFLARVYLYLEDWEHAEIQASKIIGDADYALHSNLNTVFERNSSEALWQMGSTAPDRNTIEGFHFVLLAAPRSEPILREDFVNSFEAGDKRGVDWIGTFTVGNDTWYYPGKYKIGQTTIPGTPVTEFLSIFGLAEQYLIRAEARIQQDNIAGGVADLNFLRGKRRMDASAEVPDPLPDISTMLSKEAALLVVEEERKHELFTEWGHRWFDLRRTGRADAVLGPLKGSNWQSTDVYFPLPQNEIDRNPNL